MKKIHHHPARVRDAIGKVACGLPWSDCVDTPDWDRVTCRRCLWQRDHRESIALRRVGRYKDAAALRSLGR